MYNSILKNKNKEKGKGKAIETKESEAPQKSREGPKVALNHKGRFLANKEDADAPPEYGPVVAHALVGESSHKVGLYFIIWSSMY